MNEYMKYRQALKNGQVTPAKKGPKKIKPVSDKRAILNREYAKESRPFWKGKQCQIRSPVCTGAAQGIHHRKGKATKALLMDKRYLHVTSVTATWKTTIRGRDRWDIKHQGFKK